MRLALFQPDIPQNLGAAIRLGACLHVAVDVIEPCGFPLGDKALKRVAMDYGVLAEVVRHGSWGAFLERTRSARARIALFTTRGARSYLAHRFAPDAVLLFGRESAGAPEAVHAAADARLLIPIAGAARSLNLVTAAAMALGEGLRQTGGFPGERS